MKAPSENNNDDCAEESERRAGMRLNQERRQNAGKDAPPEGLTEDVRDGLQVLGAQGTTEGEAEAPRQSNLSATASGCR
jgi:hypothetical protein